MKNIIKIFNLLIIMFGMISGAYANVNVGKEYYKQQKYKKAFNEFLIGATDGSAIDQYYLGLMYANGKGVTKDYVTAYMWETISTNNGNKEAINTKKIIAQLISIEQIAKAQDMARTWMAKHQ